MHGFTARKIYCDKIVWIMSRVVEEELQVLAKQKKSIEMWQVAGGILVMAVIGLLGYAFWPVDEPVSAARELSEVVAQVAEIDALVLKQSDFPIRVEATGHLQAWRRAEVSAEMQGIAIKRYVEEGDRVRKGQVLIELDRRDAELELAEARAEWLRLQAEYAVRFRVVGQESEVDSLVFAEAETNLQEAQMAFENGSLTADELDEVRRIYDGLTLQKPEMRSAVQAANLGLTQAEQRKARAELALARTRVVAPFSGRVSDLVAEEGRRVSMGESILTLLDDTRMKVDVDVLEADIVQLSQGATARIRIPSLGDQEVDGIIYSINPSVDPATGAGRVTVSISNRDGRLLSGLFTYTYLEAERLYERLVLPSDAILVRQGRDLVFRVEEGNAMWVYVELGARSGNQVEVVSGLAPGDTIAVSGHFALAHDVPVNIKQLR